MVGVPIELAIEAAASTGAEAESPTSNAEVSLRVR